MLDTVLSTWSLSHQVGGLGTEPSTQRPGVGDSERWPPLGEEPGVGDGGWEHGPQLHAAGQAIVFAELSNELPAGPGGHSSPLWGSGLGALSASQLLPTDSR